MLRSFPIPVSVPCRPRRRCQNCERIHWALARRGLGQASSTTSASIQALAAAIILQENAPASLNNPGALMYAGQAGATAGAGGLAQFATYQDGVNALYNQLALYANGTCGACNGQPLTISQMTAIYAPAGIAGNDPTTYANNLAAALGVSTDTSLASLSSSGASDDYGDDSFDLSSLLPTSIDPMTLAAVGIFGALVIMGLARGSR